MTDAEKIKRQELKWVKIFITGVTDDGKTKIRFWHKVRGEDAGKIIEYIAKVQNL